MELFMIAAIITALFVIVSSLTMGGMHDRY